jgi:hypothetical protein
MQLPFRPRLMFSEVRVENAPGNRVSAFTVHVRITNTSSETVYFRSADETSHFLGLKTHLAFGEDSKTEEIWLPWLEPRTFDVRLWMMEPPMSWRSLAPGKSVFLKNQFAGEIQDLSKKQATMRIELKVTDWRGRNASASSEPIESTLLSLDNQAL